MKDPVEQQIEEAVARGEFDQLPGSGKPLPRGDDSPGWWARKKIAEMRRQDRLDGLKRSIDHRMGELWPLPSEDQVRARVVELNEDITAANQELAGEEYLELLQPDTLIALWRRMWRARA